MILSLTFILLLIGGLCGLVRAVLENQTRYGTFSARERLYVGLALQQCPSYQALLAQGKTPDEIMEILELENITPGRFEELTGKPWPEGRLR